MSGSHSTVIPALRYADAHAAIEWLCSVIGFEKSLVVDGPNGTVAHAQLKLGGGMVMLGSATVDTPYGRLIKQPKDIGGFETQAACVIVPDADAVYARAKASGAEILLDIKTQDYGGRDFTCRDPGGHIWSIGTYDPWQQGGQA